MINDMILGAIIMCSFTASLFFLRFWRTTKDRFFLFFSLAFCLDGIGRIMLGVLDYSNEQEPFLYVTRLISFLLILYAIVDKNRLREPKQ